MFFIDRDEICLKTLKYGRTARVLQNFTPKLTKTLNSDEKHLFVFLQKWAYFSFKNAANKLKHNVVSKIALESVGKH